MDREEAIEKVKDMRDFIIREHSPNDVFVSHMNEAIKVLSERPNGECWPLPKPYRKEGKIDLIVEFANEIKAYCKLKNTCYGCPFFDEEVAYEDACRLNDRPMFWKGGKSNNN